MINDWLDLARINRGRLIDKIKTVALENILEKQVRFMKPSAEEEGITLELVAPASPALVLGDEQTLDQVFANILSNAVKYNRPQGSVKIALREENGFIVVDVADTGVGIAKEHLPFIFDQFYRVSRAEDRKSKGTGLGLSIARKIVEAHNGSIRVVSEPGRGSTFTVLLPKAEHRA